jgi:hypothetical protein
VGKTKQKLLSSAGARGRRRSALLCLDRPQAPRGLLAIPWSSFWAGPSRSALLPGPIAAVPRRPRPRHVAISLDCLDRWISTSRSRTCGARFPSVFGENRSTGQVLVGRPIKRPWIVSPYPDPVLALARHTTETVCPLARTYR